MLIEPETIVASFYFILLMWVGLTETIFELLGFNPNEVTFLQTLLLWLVICFVVYVMFALIFRTSKIFFRFFLNKLDKT